jgi:transitional endoplasmic reticulum ATPase
MRELRIPAWLAQGVLERYHADASHVFLLHGNIRDVQPFGGEYRPLVEGLKLLLTRRSHAVLYDVASGLSFPDAEREQAVRRTLGLRGVLPNDPARALALLDALLARAPSGSAAVIIDFAHHVVPAGASSSVERSSIATLARWATEPRISERRPIVLLIAPLASDVSEEIVGVAAETVEVPRPDLDLRTAFASDLRAKHAGMPWEQSPAELAAETGGLALAQIEDAVERARGAQAPLTRQALLASKMELLRQEYGDVLEILSPRFGLSAVGGLEHATTELREVADILRRGITSAAPMGIALMGPPGTGKSYLAECFAKECGLLCVRFRPLRQMYVGQSERNQLKAFAAIRALAPVVVIVDESDQAEGGSRDQGSGDSGVTERMRGAAFSFWGDSTLRGRVLRIDITNRIDLIDAAMRRSGRTDLKIPILMPDEQARRQIFDVTVRKHQLPCAITDFTLFAQRTDGYTGSDIELALTSAYRFALRDGAPAVTEQHLKAALDDMIPAVRDRAAIDRMTLLALDECRNKRLLPRNHEAIRRAIEERTGSST